MDLLYLPVESSQDVGYGDLLKDVRRLGVFGSVQFSKDIYTPVRYKHKVDRSPQDVWKSVLQADRVHWIVSNIAREEQRDRREILKEASKILQEMGYKEHLNLVRFFGFSLYHIMNSIYHEGVFYNQDTLKVIKEAVREYPVILMPSHRCYMDFLVLSVVSVHLGLPLPAIASGMDFMTMRGIGFLLRSSGAFFMRRSFGSDKLYWALFTEYVHTLIINSDRTIEFFIEGTRSRSGKSLNPKLGLFSLVAEPYLKAQIYDVIIVPVSISYERILEESLYAYELLGVPKPKESTSGLFQATGILQQNYGCVHVHFAAPISIRKEFGHMDRAVHACYPRYMLRLTLKEQSYLKDLAYKVVQIQQKNMVISLWSIVSTIISQSPGGIGFTDLVERTQWLLDLLRKCNVKVRVQSGNLADIARHVLFQYNHLVKVTSKQGEDGRVCVKQHEKSLVPSRSAKKLNAMPASTCDKAAIHLMIASYRNQLIHVFVKPALTVFALKVKGHQCQGNDGQVDMHGKNLSENFAFIRELFYKEFIFAPNRLKSDYEEGITFLCHADALQKSDDVLFFHSRGDRLIAFLRNLMLPFFICYGLICDYVSEFHHSCEIKELCDSIQLWIAERVEENLLPSEILSKDMINNGIHGLGKTGPLKITKESGKHIVYVRRMQAQMVSKRIKDLMEGDQAEVISQAPSSRISKL